MGGREVQESIGIFFALSTKQEEGHQVPSRGAGRRDARDGRAGGGHPRPASTADPRGGSGRDKPQEREGVDTREPATGGVRRILDETRTKRGRRSWKNPGGQTCGPCLGLLGRAIQWVRNQVQIRPLREGHPMSGLLEALVTDLGVTGLDEVLGGGLIPQRAYLVRGGPGTGKTTLGIPSLAEARTKRYRPRAVPVRKLSRTICGIRHGTSGSTLTSTTFPYST